MQCVHKEPHWHYGNILCHPRCPDDAGSKWVYHRRRERIYLGPESAEIVIHLHRNHQAGLRDSLDVILKIHRFRCSIDDQPVAELKPFASKEDVYHFPIEGEFFTNPTKFPKGFYLGDISINDCIVDTIEIVKSPGVSVGEAITTVGKCFDTKVYVDDYCPVENCVEEEQKEKGKCRKLCEPEIVVAGVIDNPMYISDLSELFEG